MVLTNTWSWMVWINTSLSSSSALLAFLLIHSSVLIFSFQLYSLFTALIQRIFMASRSFVQFSLFLTPLPYCILILSLFHGSCCPFSMSCSSSWLPFCPTVSFHVSKSFSRATQVLLLSYRQVTPCLCLPSRKLPTKGIGFPLYSSWSSYPSSWSC